MPMCNATLQLVQVLRCQQASRHGRGAAQEREQHERLQGSPIEKTKTGAVLGISGAGMG